MMLLGVLLGASASFWAVGRYVRASEGLPTSMVSRTIKRIDMVSKRARLAKARRDVSSAFDAAPLQSAGLEREQQTQHDDLSLEHGEDGESASLHRGA